MILLSGQVTFVLLHDDGEELVLPEQPGDVVVVPKNTWHRAKTDMKTKLFFVTPGEGTQHKAL